MAKSWSDQMPTDASRQQRCAHEQLERKMDEIAMVPRMRFGRRVRVSRRTRTLWSAVRKAKTRPALLRRGQAFLDALLQETRAEPPVRNGQEPWQLTYRVRTHEWGGDPLPRAHPEVRKHRGGMTGSPTVVNKRLFGAYGQFSKSFMGGIYEVRVDLSKAHIESDAGLTEIEAIRKTFGHEVLHTLDDDANLDDERHGRRWESRLARFYEMFPYRQWGRA